MTWIRARSGGAIDPIAVFRALGYRKREAKDRPQVLAGRAGIV